MIFFSEIISETRQSSCLNEKGGRDPQSWNTKMGYPYPPDLPMTGKGGYPCPGLDREGRVPLSWSGGGEGTPVLVWGRGRKGRVPLSWSGGTGQEGRVPLSWSGGTGQEGRVPLSWSGGGGGKGGGGKEGYPYPGQGCTTNEHPERSFHS